MASSNQDLSVCDISTDGERSDDPRSNNAASTIQHEERQAAYTRIIVLLLLLVALAYVAFDYKEVQSATVDFLGWVEGHPYQGMLAVIFVYILATLLFVPGALLTFGTGYALGSIYDNKVEAVIVASTIVFIGASLGSICAFLLGRYLFRSCVVRLASSYPIFQAIDRALQSNGLKIMILLRLSPLIPYNALDYMSGITAIPLWLYALAIVGMLPQAISLAFIGASASNLTDDSATENMTFNRASIVAGVVFAVGGVFVASYYSKQELDKILAEEDMSDELLQGNEQSDHEANEIAYSDQIKQNQSVG